MSNTLHISLILYFPYFSLLSFLFECFVIQVLLFVEVRIGFRRVIGLILGMYALLLQGRDLYVRDEHIFYRRLGHMHIHTQA